jgi:delta-aminolevulinic acid dehydratase/porphobilinogen synthase
VPAKGTADSQEEFVSECHSNSMDGVVIKIKQQLNASGNLNSSIKHNSVVHESSSKQPALSKESSSR